MTKQEVYKILKTGSDGNAILYFKNQLLVDIGVSYKEIEPYKNEIKYVFISHIHSDHFNKRTIKKLANEKPLIKFVVGEYLKQNLLDLGLIENQISIVRPNTKYRLLDGLLIEPIPLYHNVDNMGLKTKYGDIRLLHATDTYTLEHITALNYDYYMVERNYCKIKVQEMQDEKVRLGIFDYTIASTENHLSKQDVEIWLGKNNKNDKGEVVYLHESKNNL